MRIKEYYRLIKPGEVYGNSLTALAGLMIGSKGHVRPETFAALLIGLAAVMAGCLVINNWIDRGIDRRMERTRTRALAAGTISEKNALIFAAILLLAGFFVVSLTNFLTVLVVAVGFIDYVILYSLAKRRTPWSTVIGSVSGAVPIAAGYTAASGRLDSGGWLLFAAMVIWQMPHFYSIGIFRRDEYAAAGLPILPVKFGSAAARNRIMWYILAYLPCLLLLYFLGYVGKVFAVIMTIAWLYWVRQGMARGGDHAKWARKTFGSAMVVLLAFCLMLMASPYLP